MQPLPPRGSQVAHSSHQAASEADARQLSDVPKSLQLERLKALLPIALKHRVDEAPTRVAFRNGSIALTDEARRS